jgi:hypothetical protein
MDSKDLKQRKALLENMITNEVESLLDSFKNETGLYPNDIQLYFGETTTLESPDRTYRFTRASVSIVI